VVVTEDQRRMHPGVGLAFDERPITFAAPVLGPARLRVRAFGPPGGTDLLLPYFGVLRVAVVPPVQGDGTSGGGGGRGR
jgi:hypothetical protein